MPDQTVEIITCSRDRDLSKIDDFVCKQKYGNIFQHPDMFLFYETIPNYTPIYIIIKNRERIIASLMALQISDVSKIRKHLTQRILIFGDPVIQDNITEKEEALNLLLQNLQSYISKNTLFIQFRLFELNDEYDEVFAKNGYSPQKRLNAVIETKSRDQCWKALSKSKRRQINKSLENGAKIIEPRNLNQVREYYKILSALFKTKIKKPLASFYLFENFYDFSRNNKLGKLLFIELKEKIIGGIVCPVFPEKFIYEWYICGMDKEYKKEGIYPSVLATWAAIDYALKNHIPLFNLMGAGKPGIQYGVRDFKLRFGGQKTIAYRYNKIVNRGLYEIAEVAYNLRRWLF